MGKTQVTSYRKENPGHTGQRRRFKRYAFFSQVRLFSTEYERLDFARCTNLGQGGMRFTTKLQTLIGGSQVVIEIKGIGEGAMLTLLGEIRYCLERDGKTQECGVAFLAMNEELQQQIQRLVKGCPEVTTS